MTIRVNRAKGIIEEKQEMQDEDGVKLDAEETKDGGQTSAEDKKTDNDVTKGEYNSNNRAGEVSKSALSYENNRQENFGDEIGMDVIKSHETVENII